MTNKRKIYVAISWILVVVCMGVIFSMSGASAEESSQMSNSLIQKILSFTGLNISPFVIRKTAHFCEFAGLSLLLSNAIFASFEKKKSPIFAYLIASLYAVTDEIHQLFSDGRACQIRDMLIDSFGALLGALFAYLMILLYKKHIERKKENGNS